MSRMPIENLPHPRPALCRTALLAAFSIGIAGADAGAQLLRNDPSPPKLELPEVRREAGVLDRFRPHQPEWLAMLVEILRGGQLAPGKGWFEDGKSSTRFDWPAVAARLDRDRDSSISRQEFSGPDADFRRLDRDRSGALTIEDFRFPENALARSRSRMIMSFADRDRDGRVSAEEYGRMIFLASRDELTRYRYFSDSVDELADHYRACQKEGIPFLGMSDFRETIDLFARQKGLEPIPDPDADLDVAPRSTLLRALIRREIGVLRAGPSTGDPAPDFSLPTPDGRGRVALSGLLGRRPVVLIFGNYTSAGFREEAGSLSKLYQRYRGRAEFLMVYVRESHPTDGWQIKANVKPGILVAQPPDDRRRAEVARECRKKLALEMPMVVDGVDDRVGILYSGMPDRLYLVDARGLVAYKGGRGPLVFKPAELEQSLLLLLDADPSPTTDPARSPTPPRAR